MDGDPQGRRCGLPVTGVWVMLVPVLWCGVRASVSAVSTVGWAGRNEAKAGTRSESCATKKFPQDKGPCGRWVRAA